MQLNQSVDGNKSLQITETSGAISQEADQPQPPGPLMVKYNNLKRSIGRFADFIESEKFKELDYYGCLSREERMEAQWRNLDELHFEVLLKYDDVHDTQQEEYDELEDRYFKASAALKKKIKELNPDVQAAGVAVAGATQPMSINVNMPVQQHNIPNTWGTFDGSVLKWKQFRDRFKEAMHDNKDVSLATKFSRLQDSLKGKAAQALGQWHITAENYLDAWERLNELYDRPYVIASEHMRQFYRLPQLQGNPTANELQRMSNVAHETFRQLRAMELPVDHWDFVFVFNLRERLDKETQKQWELQKTGEWPTLKEMLTFIDKQAEALANMQTGRSGNISVTVANSNQASNNAGAFRTTQNDNKRAGARGLSPSGGAIKKKMPPCECCDDDHPIYFCPQFLPLTMNAKKDFLQRRKICENCLKKGHRKDVCTEVKCRLEACANDPAHNSLLCPNKRQRPVSHAVAVQNNLTQKRQGGA